METLPLTEGEDQPRKLLDELVREGAQRMLKAALEAEVDAFVEQHQGVVDDQGRRQVVRNGRLPARTVATGAGSLEVEQPRVRDLRGAAHPEAVEFRSSILPRYLRRSRSMDELLPWLYLKGISQADMRSALETLVGSEAQGFSAATVTRLTATWSEEYEHWSQRGLGGKEYVYLWADGIHFNIRLEEDRQCILVLMGATPEGRKELLGVVDGYRES